MQKRTSPPRKTSDSGVLDARTAKRQFSSRTTFERATSITSATQWHQNTTDCPAAHRTPAAFAIRPFRTTAYGQTATFSQQGIPQKDVIQAEISATGRQPANQPPGHQPISLQVPHALLKTTEHQCTKDWGLDSKGRGSANAMKESTIDPVVAFGAAGPGHHGLLPVTDITHSDGDWPLVITSIYRSAFTD